MTAATFKSFFQYSSAQRSGIFFLLVISCALQFGYYFVTISDYEISGHEKQQWLSLQSQFDSLKNQKKTYSPKIYPFNPNFISDSKGYKLGMSVKEIDKLLLFRKTNKYVNSAQEFQLITGVSDSLLQTIAPYFKFPDWVTHKKDSKTFLDFSHAEVKKTIVMDINMATQEDLKKVYGIGEALSERILKEKRKFGGFVSMEQINDIWGLSPEVIEKIKLSFKIEKLPEIKKININTASINELMTLPYIRYSLAKSIVTFRSMNGTIENSEDLTKINGFSVDKVKIIALYLDFKIITSK